MVITHKIPPCSHFARFFQSSLTIHFWETPLQDFTATTLLSLPIRQQQAVRAAPNRHSGGSWAQRPLFDL